MADLDAIAERYHKALDAKPGKGPITERGIAAITDSVCDVPEMLAEVRRLNRWQAEALPVMAGLQDLGGALGLPLGERITGPAAVEAVERLTRKLDRVRALTESTESPGWVRAGDLLDALEV